MRQYFDMDSNEWVDAENPEDIANTILERSYEQVEVQAAQPVATQAQIKAPEAPAENGEALTDAQKAEIAARIAEMQKLMGK